ncbi:MAG: PQQ-binding-like beta-propeller repeat protein [Acidobacteria bacterium]|nr:PQQ-binding-like beta-propeller repeat protein [Acidobacteriota bacterium]MBI3657581.1 PQQ-binding-like beta-propeller repeat protein [Acidobacteriota bacterium]
MKRTNLLIYPVALSILLMNPVAAWQVTLQGGDNNRLNWANAVISDSEGNVIAGGYLYNRGTEEDFTVVKLDGKTGRELWQVEINGTANGRDQVNAVTVDAKGDVIAAGWILNLITSFDFAVVKLDGKTGEEIWHVEINGSANREDGVNALAVDPAGNIVAAGYIRNISTGYDFAVVKLDGNTGDELWRTEIDGTYPLSDDEAYAVAMDSQGNVIAAGRTRNVGTLYDFAVVKLEGGTGKVLWRKDIDGGERLSDWAGAVVIDREDNVIAAGVTWHTQTNEDFAVLKLDGNTGEEMWRAELNGSADAVDMARAVAVDRKGNVFAVGFVKNLVTEQDFVVVKLDGETGKALWHREFNGSSNSFDQAWNVAIDSNGNVIAGGMLDNQGRSLDFAIVNLDGSSGEEIWYTEIDGAAHGPDWLQAMTLDPQGSVIAAGLLARVPSFREVSDSDFAVIKLNGKNGNDF